MVECFRFRRLRCFRHGRICGFWVLVLGPVLVFELFTVSIDNLEAKAQDQRPKTQVLLPLKLRLPLPNIRIQPFLRVFRLEELLLEFAFQS